MYHIVPVILAGGSGKRLWPLSRFQHPKQYQSLTGGHTMLQKTILRLKGLRNVLDPIIVCNEEHRFLVAQQCHNIDIQNPTIMLEPLGKNTAPAIAAAALQSVKSSNVNDLLLLVLPADHDIKDVTAFQQAILIATKSAEKGKLVTFGIVPLNANTGYGYIKSSQTVIYGSYPVQEFVEKPNSELAQSYVDQGCYFWNSGIFLFQPSTLIDELTAYSPDIVSAVNDAVNNATHDFDFIRLEKRSFESSPNDSIDCALLEKSSNVVVIPIDAQWSDVGSWASLYDFGEKDNYGNVLSGDVIVKDTANSYINASNHMVVTVGVDDLVVIDTVDVTLVAKKNMAHKIDSIVVELQKRNRAECNNHRKVYRPWGWYDSIDSGKNFQVKKVCIFSGEKLSLQKHNKRSEHWVVVSGEATVINGSKSLVLKKGESTFIPSGVVHRLENKTEKPLEVIEVQTGSYIGEDDIVRIVDIYGRL